MDKFIYLGIGVLVVGVFALIVKLLAKKENVTQEDMLAEINDEQITFLKDNEVVVKDDRQDKYSWYQKGLIGQSTDCGKHYKLKVLWYNTVIQNNTCNDFQYADIKMKKEEYEKRGLGKGSIVKMLIEPHKAKGTIV